MMRLLQLFIFAAFVLLASVPSGAQAQELKIVNIRVGQGDATLIQGPVDSQGDRINVLFDAGNRSQRDGGFILRAVLRRHGVEKLDYLIISHDDADHLGGVGTGPGTGTSFLLGGNQVPGQRGDDDNDGMEDWLPGREFIDPDPEELGTGDDLRIDHFVDYGDMAMRDTLAIQKYQGIANAMGTRINVSDQQSVDTFQIDLGDGAVMTCYAANGFVRGRADRVEKVDTPNEKSLSFLVTYDRFDYLISGDLIGRKPGLFGNEDARLEFAVGQAIVADGRDVDILHVNHHGADNASEAEFLNLITPTIAIISAGNGNSHKHPRNNVLRRLTESGVDRIIQTSWGTSVETIREDVREHQAIWQQDIIIRTDGKTYAVETIRSWPAE